MKKWISYIFDGLLVIVVGIVGFIAVSMFITKNNSKFGVPSVLGNSILYISTDSMDSEMDNHEYGPGTGIIITSVSDYSSLRTCEPIEWQVDEDGNYVLDEHGERIVTKVDKSGDIVTFNYLFVNTKTGEEFYYPDTHRLVHKYYDETDGLWHFVTKGDRDNISRNPYYSIEEWDETAFIGKLTYHSKFLGTLLRISSPSVAASVGEVAWFFPVLIGFIIFFVAGQSVISSVNKYRLENKAREEMILNELLSSNIDLNDDVAVETYRAKIEVRLELKEEFAKMKEQIRKEIEKEKLRVKNGK